MHEELKLKWGSVPGLAAHLAACLQREAIEDQGLDKAERRVAGEQVHRAWGLESCMCMIGRPLRLRTCDSIKAPLVSMHRTG